MDDLSLHFDQELERRLTEIARREGVSLNEAALRLLRRGAGLIEGGAPGAVVGNALDGFVGRWSEAEETSVLTSIEAFETVDEALWK
jgi:hypothetical protein